MANSFKQMIKGGVIKRKDSGMFISIHNIHVKPGFNKRDDDERTRQADEELFNFLMNGGSVPPLEVTPRDDGGVWIVEGHRRHRAYLRCLDTGKPVDLLHVTPFVGNDVERLARVMTSNNQLPLSHVEQAAVVKELHSVFNLSTSEIAKLVHKSVPTVEKLLTLSTANHDVQLSVKSGEVSVDVAVDRVKEHGDNAGKVLEKDKAAAVAAGKKKVTRSLIAPEISVKKARRLVELITLAGIDANGNISLEGFALAEVLKIVEEQKAIEANRGKLQ
ncbi:chromosome partitioning protein ParB [Shigella dysenteriae]|uniref:ParB/RepB/Spo0J family partition protein n=1 Tax=Escherichia coli TaxID=562 RepID=UPI000DFDBA0D|nr:chromosome partitioning protein ParB [Escherichia coli]EFP6908586.1 chromosome partitioning protein ParB [Shigella dysenteriae]EFL5716749.1 chromosome partitioning protein ParB [Escherichia coli]EFP7033406.1 chromosome partitioning protein ParB [Shigella dysenteriae]EFW3898089.1 chromosome partitioning protein ParB [Shigella dysenteriae]MCX3825168.1 chromosome partitioning protein ParB [Escherichia coli]